MNARFLLIATVVAVAGCTNQPWTGTGREALATVAPSKAAAETADKPRFDVSPSALTLVLPQFYGETSEHVGKVVLSVSAATLPAAGPTLSVTADSGIEINCDPSATSPPTSNFQASCVLGSWSFDTGNPVKASEAIWVRIGNNAAAVSASWQLHVTSNDAIGTVTEINVRTEVGEPAAGPSGEAPAGEYEVVFTRIAPVAPIGAPTIQIPMTASVGYRGVVFYDPTGLISPSGQFACPYERDNNGYSESVTTEPWIVPRGNANNPYPDTGSMNAYVANCRPSGFRNGVWNGNMDQIVGITAAVLSSGDVTQPNGRTFRWSYQMRKSSRTPHTACSGDGDCAGGNVCDPLVQLCLPKATPSKPAQAGRIEPDTLQSGRLAAWRAALPKAMGQAFASMPLARVPNMYDDGSSQSAVTFAGALLFDDASLPPFSDSLQLGYNLCVRDWKTPPEATAIIGRATPAPQTPSTCVAPEHGTIPIVSVTSKSFCDDIYTFAQSWWDQCAAPQHTDPRGLALLRRSYTPCAVTNPQMPQSDTLSQQSCNRVTRGEQGVEPTPAPSPDPFFITSCIPTRASYKVKNPKTNAEEELPILLCPNVAGDLGSDAALEKMTCWDPAQSSNASILDTWVPHNNKTFPVSGTAACSPSRWDFSTATRFPLEVPLFTYRDRQNSTPFAELSANDMLKSCLEDLQREVPAFTTSAVDNVRAFFAPRACVNLGMIAATTETAHRLWRTDQFWTKKWRGADVTALKQWLVVHDFLAHQGTIQWGAAAVLAAAANPATDDTSAASLDKVRVLLDEMERGWDMVLAGEISDALVASPGSWDGGSYSPNGVDTQVPLSVWAMRAMISHLQLAETLMDRLQQQTYAACQSGGPVAVSAEVRERVGAALRYALAVESLARLRWGNTGAINANDPTYIEFSTTVARIIKRAGAVNDCTNPLGISDDDVPLFFGDVTGNVGRFFASSTYLLGLATDAVNTAGSALSAARTAWSQARAAAIQDVVNGSEFDRRVDDIKTTYGKPIVEACGLPTGTDPRGTLDQFGPSSLALANCYLDTSRNECAVDKGVLPQDATCYHGTLGESALALKTANVQWAAARQQVSHALSVYKNNVNMCVTLYKDAQFKAAVEDQYEGALKSLTTELDDFTVIASRSDANAQCAGVAAASWGSGCIPVFGSAVTREAIISLQRKVTEMEASHARFLDTWHDLVTTQECWTTANNSWGEIAIASLILLQRGTEADAAWLRFRNTMKDLSRDITEGRAAVARETARRIPSVAHPYWFDDSVQTFMRQQLRAKRLTFLALKAVEYDFQLSLPLRASVVGAIHPDELTAVIETLHSYHDALKIRGKVPTDLAFDVSLRDDLLKLNIGGDGKVDRNGAPARFHDVLFAAENRFYDSQGRYLGQALPFSLREDNVPDKLQCAERLWAVTADLIGDNMGPKDTYKVKLLKRNTAYSKQCGPSGGWQTGLVRPSVDLFGLQPIDPAANAQMTAGTITAAKNQDLTTFLGNGTLNGTTELAGRGLYGDYVLLVPFAADSARREFAVDLLQDIVLRFDYLSSDGINLAVKGAR